MSTPLSEVISEVITELHKDQARWITDEFRDKLNLSLRPQRQGPPGPGEKLDRLVR
jgi:hypothetical protein